VQRRCRRISADLFHTNTDRAFPFQFARFREWRPSRADPPLWRISHLKFHFRSSLQSSKVKLVRLLCHVSVKRDWRAFFSFELWKELSKMSFQMAVPEALSGDVWVFSHFIRYLRRVSEDICAGKGFATGLHTPQTGNSAGRNQRYLYPSCDQFSLQFFVCYTFFQVEFPVSPWLWDVLPNPTEAPQFECSAASSQTWGDSSLWHLKPDPWGEGNIKMGRSEVRTYENT